MRFVLFSFFFSFLTMSINSNFYIERSAEEENEEDETSPLVGNGAEPARGARGASFTSSVFNLMNAIMGSGILGLAYAMASTGIVAFCLLLVLVSSLAAYSIHLLLKLCDQTGINSYEDLGEKALQKPGKALVGLAILIQNIGAMSSYLFILKSELPAAISSFLSPDSPGDAWYENGRLLLVLVTVAIVVPLSLLPRIGFLGYTSSLAFVFMLFFTVVIVVKKWSIPCPLPHNGTAHSNGFQISNSSDSECTPKLFDISPKSGFAVPTMAFSFLCHTAVLPIYCELDRPTKARMQQVTNVSIALSFLLYLVSALFGYLTFYAHVDSELLVGYDEYLPRDVMVMMVRLAILLAVLLTVPLIHFPARKAVVLLLFGRRAFSWFLHVGATLSILSVVLLLASFVPDIRNVFGVVGIFYLKISHERLTTVDSIGAVLLVVFGLIMGVLSFSVIVITWAQSS